jgi:hypothetical protein
MRGGLLCHRHDVARLGQVGEVGLGLQILVGFVRDRIDARRIFLETDVHAGIDRGTDITRD